MLLECPCRDGSKPALSEAEGTRPGRAQLGNLHADVAAGRFDLRTLMAYTYVMYATGV